MTSFGLHVGNTNSCLAVHKDYSANVVANYAGSRVTPTCVGFTEDGEVLTGLSAKQFLARFPKSGVKTGNKAAIGETTNDCSCTSRSGPISTLILSAQTIKRVLSSNLRSNATSEDTWRLIQPPRPP